MIVDAVREGAHGDDRILVNAGVLNGATHDRTVPSFLVPDYLGFLSLGVGLGRVPPRGYSARADRDYYGAASESGRSVGNLELAGPRVPNPLAVEAALDLALAKLRLHPRLRAFTFIHSFIHSFIQPDSPPCEASANFGPRVNNAGSSDSHTAPLIAAERGRFCAICPCSLGTASAKMPRHSISFSKK